MESLNREKSYSRSRSKSNSQSKTKKLVIDNEDTSKSIISKFLKKYLGKKQEQMKQIDIDKIIRRNAANTIQTYTKKMLTKKRTNAATLIQNSVRMKTAKQNIDMRKNSRDIGVKIGNILCNNTLPKAISEIEKIIDVRKNFSRSKASVSMVKSIKDLRLLNCTLGRFNFPILTETIEDSTIFNVSFASTHFSGIKFSNVVFLSGTYNSEAYKVYTKYYGLEDKDKYSSKIGKKSDFKLNFTKSILKDCIFENCTFYNIIFNECKLSGCIFRNCKFISCSFKNTIFDELELDPVSKTPFLKGIYFKNCSIIFKKDTQYFEFISHNTNIDFSKSTMEEQKLYSFNDCLFTNNWTGLIGFLGDSSPMKQNIIKFIYFKNCSITLYNFSNLKIFNTDSDLSNFNKCIIKDCKFANCEINYNTFLDCDIQNTNFQQSVLYQEYNSKYKNNKFIKCNFLLINLVGLPRRINELVFEDIDFTKSCFSCTNLIDVNFKKCNMQGCDFSPRIFTDGTTRNTVFNSVKFEDSIIKTCNFQQVEGLTRYDFTKVANRDLTSVNFTAVELEGSNFEGCKLTGTIFQLATLIECNFRNVHSFQNADFTNIIGVPDNIPEGLNIDGTIQAANETHNRFSFIKNNSEKIITIFSSYYEKDSILMMIDESQYYKLENVREELLKLKTPIEEVGKKYKTFYKIKEQPSQLIKVFMTLYLDLLTKEEMNKLSANLSKCINKEFIEKINSNTTICDLVMHSIWFLTPQCSFYKKKFIDLYIDDIFNAHGEGGTSCLLGMIERLVSIHTQVIETMKATLEPYKTIQQLKSNDELYKLFYDIPDKSYNIYIEKTIYVFNKILNLMIPDAFLSESIEEENIFSDIVLDLEFTKLRDNWYSDMNKYYNLYIKHKNGEDIGSDKQIVEKLIDSGIFIDINNLLNNYKGYIEFQDKISSVVDKLKKIESRYRTKFVKDKCSKFIKTIDEAINKEIKFLMEAIFGIALKNPETDTLTPEEIGEYLEGGTRTKIKSTKQIISKGNKKLEAEIISVFFKYNNVLDKDKEISNEIQIEFNKDFKKILQNRREKYYIKRYK
jgi:uncharacterized protein YjbI with pentapeptide repeats|tara:strand:+ start:4371 stop:7586 length:3216 start_codon:yes stop_codon:yes gene_type:complete